MPDLSAAINPFTGYIFLALGVLYLVKPDIFRRWFWLRTDIAQRLLSPSSYIVYMRGWGVFMLLAGGCILAKYYLGSR